MVKKLLMAGVLLAVSPSAFAGTISMSSTAYPESVVVEVTINDTGGSLECGWLAITRFSGVSGFYSDVAYIERQAGMSTHRFVDTNVELNTLYCYGMGLRVRIDPFLYLECPTNELCNLFDCFYQIQTCVNTGPDPAFLGHGFLSSEFPDGSPVDDNEVKALLYYCGAPNSFLALHSVPIDALPEIDSGNGVDVYGTWWCCWAQGVWLLVAEIVDSHTCEVAVEETTWGRVKSLYRE